MKKIAANMLLLLCTGVLARADVVTFKNGDKLTGTLVSVTAGKLNLKTDALGDVAIPLAKIQTFSAEMPGAVITKDDRVLRGMVSLLPSGEWQIAQNGPPQTLAADLITSVLPQTTYDAIEAPAKPWQEWKGNANFGYAFQRGNQNTHSISASAAIVRDRPSDILFAPHFRTTYGLTMLFADAQQDGTEITSNTIDTTLREDYLFTARNFFFGSGELDHVDTQGLYLQQSYGGGFGRDLVHNARTIFSVLGGINYVADHYDTIPSVHSAEAFVGETLGSQLTPRIRVDEHFNFYPDLEHSGQYRFDGAVNFGLKLSAHFTANVGLMDLYLTQVPPGSLNNNFIFTSGLGYAF